MLSRSATGRDELAIDLAGRLASISRMTPKKFLAALAFTFGLWTCQAEVRLHALFSDNMVLQRGVSVPIWGWADDGEQVTVEYGGQVAKTKAKEGRWLV